MAGEVDGSPDRREFSFPINPARALAILAIVTALAVPVLASIRAASRPAVVAGEAPKPPATRVAIPGRGAMPLCPTTRGVARPVGDDASPRVEGDPDVEAAGSAEDPTSKGRL